MTNYVFASCDEQYLLAHGKAFIESAKANGENPWINVYVDSHDQLLRLARVWKSDETTKITFFSFFDEKPDRTVYSCSRFIVLPQILLQIAEGDGVLVVDVDSVIRRPIDWKDFEQCDWSLFLREPLPGTVGWEQIGTHVAAGAAFFNRSSMGIASRVAEGIRSSFKHQGRLWFTDQVVLWRTYQHILQESFGYRFVNMPKKYIDWEFNDDTVIWTGKGERKYTSETYKKEVSKYMA